MGRVFVTEMEGQGPVYKCKQCEIDFAVYEPVHMKSEMMFENPTRFGLLYYFHKCYNVVIGTHEVFICKREEDVDLYMRELFCVRCTTHVGFYFETEPEYNEANFYLNRWKIQGPLNGSDNENLGDGTSVGSSGISDGSDDYEMF